LSQRAYNLCIGLAYTRATFFRNVPIPVLVKKTYAIRTFNQEDVFGSYTNRLSDISGSRATVAAEHGGESSKNIHNFGSFRFNGAEQLPELIFAVSFSSLVIEIAAISEIMSLEKEI
jgi:hypothetical protein